MDQQFLGWLMKEMPSLYVSRTSWGDWHFEGDDESGTPYYRCKFSSTSDNLFGAGTMIWRLYRDYIDGRHVPASDDSLA